MHVSPHRSQRVSAIALPSGSFDGRNSIARRATSLFLAAACAVTAVSISVPAAQAATRTRYVSPSGSNSNPGTSTKPWKTIGKAAAAARPGDIVYVRPGTYSERVYLRNSGTSSAPIRFVGTTNGKRARVARGFYVKSNYTRVEGFEVYPASGLGSGARNPDRTYADAAIQLSGHHDVAKNNYIHDMAGSAPSAILTTGSYNLVQGNRIHNAWKMHISASGSNVTIRKNRSTIDPSYLNRKPANWKAIQLGINGTSKMLVEGNYIKGPGDGNMIHIPAPVSNLTFRRNTILLPGRRKSSGTHTQTFGFYKSAKNVTFDGNVIGNAQPLPSGYVAGFTHFFFGTTNASGVYENLNFRNNLFLGQLDGSYYLQFKAGDRLNGLKFDNNLVHISSGWRLPDRKSGVVARNNIVMRGSIGGSRDYNLYPTRKASGEGSHTRVGSPRFLNGSLSSKTGYGVSANWNLASGSPAIDSGTAAGAAKDRLGRRRVDISSVRNRGGGSPNYGDIGPMEKQK